MSNAATSRFKPKFWLYVAAALFISQILILYVMGRFPICECGYIKFFETEVNSAGNSQHLADWYMPSHIIHGFVFYAIGYILFRKRSIAMRFAFAVFLEASWEIVENTPMIIDHYRSATIAVGYTGDSILNSAMDTIFMSLGFFFASRAPMIVTLFLAIVFELYTGWIIRDNLVLNVIMLVWPVEAIKEWQGAL